MGEMPDETMKAIKNGKGLPPLLGNEANSNKQTGIATKHGDESFESVIIYVLLLYVNAGLMVLAGVIVCYLLYFLFN